MEKLSCVYCHISLIDSRMYVGQCKGNPNSRWGRNGNGYKKGIFHDAIKEFGWNNFLHIIIADNLTPEEANILEDELIELWNLRDRNYGFNRSRGGKVHHGYSRTEEERKHISENRKGKGTGPQSKPRELTPAFMEARKKVGEKNKGRKMPKESIEKAKETKIKNGTNSGWHYIPGDLQKENISKALKEYYKDKPGPANGAKRSEETKKLQSLVAFIREAKKLKNKRYGEKKTKIWSD